MKTGLDKIGTVAPSKIVRTPFAVERFRRHKATRFTVSLRIPALPANKTLLRKLRAAEQADWERAIAVAPRMESQSANAALRERVRAQSDQANLHLSLESAFFWALTCAGGMALWLSLVSAARLPGHWPKFVNFVAQVLR